MGGLTILFNNAGTGSQAPLHQWDPEEWNRLVAVNLTGVYLGFRAAVPHLLASGGGSIVSTASISGTRRRRRPGPARRPARLGPCAGRVRAPRTRAGQTPGWVATAVRVMFLARRAGHRSE